MLTSTHVLVGAGLGVAAAAALPELSGSAILAGFLGGGLPDADRLATHRRTTHFPVLATVLALPVVLFAYAVGGTGPLLLAVFALAVALHAPMDLFAGGVEPEPWLARSERGVYDHVAGRWHPPRRWIRYAGAPEDLLLAAVGVPATLLASGHTRSLLAATLLGSVALVLVPRRLSRLSARLPGVSREPSE